jgi:transcription elongation GreA/GreB family factor
VAQVSDLRGQAESLSYAAARDETAALTEQIERLEREIDERVNGLYGL